MTDHSTLPLVVILLATAVVMVVIFRRVHMPAILGYRRRERERAL